MSRYIDADNNQRIITTLANALESLIDYFEDVEDLDSLIDYFEDAETEEIDDPLGQ